MASTWTVFKPVDAAGEGGTNGGLARLGRTFDGIALGILCTAFVLCHPRLGVTPLGALSNLHVLPVLGVVGATLVLRVPAGAGETCRSALDRLRMAGLSAAGLIPFVSWWLRAAENPYLMVCGSAGIFAALWYLLELSTFLAAVYGQLGCDRLVLEARIARILTLYLLLIPVLAVYVAFIAGMVVFPGVLLSDLHDTWLLIPPFLRCAMVLPVLQLSWLLWRTPLAPFAAMPGGREAGPGG